MSELDYSFRRAGLDLQMPPDKARAWVMRSKRWKYVLYEGLQPQLFDLENDPRELVDRGADPALATVRAEYDERLFEWARNWRTRITLSNDDVAKRADTHRRRGIIIGEW